MPACSSSDPNYTSYDRSTLRATDLQKIDYERKIGSLVEGVQGGAYTNSRDDAGVGRVCEGTGGKHQIAIQISKLSFKRNTWVCHVLKRTKSVFDNNKSYEFINT